VPSVRVVFGLRVGAERAQGPAPVVFSGVATAAAAAALAVTGGWRFIVIRGRVRVIRRGRFGGGAGRRRRGGGFIGN